MVRLYINFYIDKNADRQSELDYCFIQNIQNVNIDWIYVIATKDHIDYIMNLQLDNSYLSRLVFLTTNKRPSYNDYFKLSQIYSKEDDISIISNLDILIPHETIQKLKDHSWEGECMALCRHDAISTNPIEYDFYNRPDSQDTWITKGAFPTIDGADFTLGVAGCDNVIAHLLSRYYVMTNPSIDLVTIHLHLSGIRNYIVHNNIERLKPPYLTIQPTKLF